MLEKVAFDPVTQDFGFAHIDDFVCFIPVQVDAGVSWDIAAFEVSGLDLYMDMRLLH